MTGAPLRLRMMEEDAVTDTIAAVDATNAATMMEEDTTNDAAALMEEDIANDAAVTADDRGW